MRIFSIILADDEQQILYGMKKGIELVIKIMFENGMPVSEIANIMEIDVESVENIINKTK